MLAERALQGYKVRSPAMAPMQALGQPTILHLGVFATAYHMGYTEDTKTNSGKSSIASGMKYALS